MVRRFRSDHITDRSDELVDRLQRDLSAKGLADVVVERVVPAVDGQQLDVERRAKGVVGADAGKEERLRVPIGEAARVV